VPAGSITGMLRKTIHPYTKVSLQLLDGFPPTLQRRAGAGMTIRLNAKVGKIFIKSRFVWSKE
jgi:hypothetical protein